MHLPHGRHETHLPQRRRGTQLPEWMREPARPLPMPRPGRPGWLAPGAAVAAQRGPVVTAGGSGAITSLFTRFIAWTRRRPA
ncbi:hypothetical protein [Micromonospora sp. NPDC049374]|uniref:hypothetical protein n=1 Tax=Micromonospora sp. NPDC049374 TaxID=3154352 RepID=UPI00342F8C81